MTTSTNITLLLEQAAGGDRNAADELFSLVYQELRNLAGREMKKENSGITLQSTAVVHEVWIKLIGNQEEPTWQNRGHFFAAAAQAMRRILVDAARARKRIKRGGENVKFEIREEELIAEKDENLIALDEALGLLKESDPRKASLVSLRYFAGLTNAQAAESLGVSVATAERDWAFAKAWLRVKLEGPESLGSTSD